MSRTLDDVYQFMRYIIRKERGVFLTTDQAMAALDNGQMNAFEEYFKQYGKDQVIHDAIKPFRIYYPFTSDTAGFVTYPQEYLHLIGNPFTVTGSTTNEVKFVNEDEFVSAINSQLRPVTNTYPIAQDTATGFTIVPQQTQIGYYTYLRRPSTPVYAVIQSGRFIAYDASNSVELEWSDAYVNNIIGRALKYVGVNMNEEGVYNFANQYEQESK